jgi:hypothetical protein
MVYFFCSFLRKVLGPKFRWRLAFHEPGRNGS